MPKPVSWRELMRRLRTFGFHGPYPGGKHPYVVRGHRKLRIPHDHGRDIGPALLAEILRQADITRDDWDSAA